MGIVGNIARHGAQEKVLIMKKLFSLGIAAGLLVAAYAAQAVPTLAGPTGQLTLPTASTAAAKTLTVAADYYNSSSSIDAVKNAVPVRATCGVTKDVEFGASYNFTKLLDENANGWGVNAKWTTPLDVLATNWAVGTRFSEIDAKVADTKFDLTEAYFVGTRQFNTGVTGFPSVTANLGLNWAQARSDNEASGVRAMFGAEGAIAKNLTLGLEYQTGKADFDEKPLSSIYLRYALPSNLTAQLGYTNADPLAEISGADKHKLTAGLSYTFGK